MQRRGLWEQLAGQTPSSRAAGAVSFNVSAGDNFTYFECVCEQEGQELLFLSIIQFFELCTFLVGKMFPTI